MEADLRRKGRGGRIGALGRVVRQGVLGHWWSAAQGIGLGGVGREVRGSGGRARGRGKVDM
jgi:hypothetical protein